MAVSAEPVSLTEALWLPASALNCYEDDPDLRSWLAEPGVLTRRLRAVCGDDFQMKLLGQHFEADDRVREVILCEGEIPWIFAQTRIPRGTLAANPWLVNLGSSPLGEAFEAQGFSERSAPEFARLMPDHPVITRALRQTAWPSQPLWMRRSTFVTLGGRFLVQEIFSPAIGRRKV